MCVEMCFFSGDSFLVIPFIHLDCRLFRESDWVNGYIKTGSWLVGWQFLMVNE